MNCSQVKVSEEKVSSNISVESKKYVKFPLIFYSDNTTTESEKCHIFGCNRLSKFYRYDFIELPGVPPSPQVFQSQVNEYSSGVNGVVNPHPPSASGVPMDSAERAERCNRASELALSGISVQRAADRYGIPRSTLCSFMRRNGLLESRNQVLHNNGMEGYHQQHTTPTPTQVTNEQIQVGSYTHFQNFPFLGLSEVVEGMDQTNCAAGGYMQGYGNYGGG